jgi:tetrathionate reductase subunit B
MAAPLVQLGKPGSPSRREVLGGGLKLAGGAVVFFMGGGAEASQKDAYDWNEHRYAYLIDATKCIGCGSCVRACKAENDVPDGFFRTWIERYLISPEGGTYVDSPNGGLDGFLPAQPAFTPTKAFFVPKMCNHCRETPCIQVCPVGASYRTKDGAVLVDPQRCIGCGYCVQACPFGSRYLSETTGTADKCTWCYHRITKGMQPACVDVCPTGTRQFGDLHNPQDPVRLAIERERVAVLQPHLLTEPQCYYLGLDKEVR